jgi:predicted RNase H-like HicB family nuclease
MELPVPRIYTAVFEPVAAVNGGGFHAYVEGLPGAIAQGDTLDEARENLRDAIRELLAVDPRAAEHEPVVHATASGAIRESISIAA